MAKALKIRTSFLCRSCGSMHAKWLGKCPDCGAWDALEEVRRQQPDARRDRLAGALGGAGAFARAGSPGAAGGGALGEAGGGDWRGALGEAGGAADFSRGALPVRLGEADTSAPPRLKSGIGELDRVLGGGLVPGMAVLVGGEPGIGKSTLLLQAAAKWASHQKARRHEGTEARRDGTEATPSASGTSASGPSDQKARRHEGTEARRDGTGAEEQEARSVPEASSPSGSGPSGSGPSGSGPFVPSCLRASVPSPGRASVPSPGRASVPVLYVTSEESAAQTRMRAQRLGIAAPELLVLAETNLERILHQVGQTGAGVVVVDSIQMVYKPEVPAAPGSVTQLRDCCMDLVYLAKQTGACVVVVGHVTKAGTLAGPKIIEHIVDTVIYFEGDRFHAHRIVRCVKNRFGGTQEVGLFEMTERGLAEVIDPGKLFAEQYGGQNPPSGSVLTAAMQGTRTLLVEVQALTAASVIGAARRKVSGFSNDRTAMIIAVLEKRGDLKLAADDVFVNVAGGVKITEPAADLAVALAIASAHFNRPLPPGTVALGELGLGGEVRPVSQLEARLKEAARLGATHAIVPHLGGRKLKLGGMALREVRRLSQAMGEL